MTDFWSKYRYLCSCALGCWLIASPLILILTAEVLSRSFGVIEPHFLQGDSLGKVALLSPLVLAPIIGISKLFGTFACWRESVEKEKTRDSNLQRIPN